MIPTFQVAWQRVWGHFAKSETKDPKRQIRRWWERLGLEAPWLLQLSAGLVLCIASCFVTTLKMDNAYFLSSESASPPGPTYAVWFFALFYLCLFYP